MGIFNCCNTSIFPFSHHMGMMSGFPMPQCAGGGFFGGFLGGMLNSMFGGVFSNGMGMFGSPCMNGFSGMGSDFLFPSMSCMGNFDTFVPSMPMPSISPMQPIQISSSPMMTMTPMPMLPALQSTAMPMPMPMPMPMAPMMPMIGGPMAFNFGGFNMQGLGSLGNSGKVSGSGPDVSDGTPTTVSGIDYSVFGSAANEIKKLRPTMQSKVFELWKYAKKKGWKISLTSGYRSTEKQKQLWALKKAGKKKCAVARPGTSRHEYGCAVDLRINGKSSGAELKELADYAKTIGVRWGGNLFNEAWHFDIDPKSTPKAKKNSNSVS